jgi:hypothetical protein
MPITPLPPIDRSSPTFREDLNRYMGMLLPQFSNDMQMLLDAAYAAVAASIGIQAASVTTTASLAATTGDKTFTVETGKAVVVGAAMLFKKNSNAADTFSGNVTAYNASTGLLTINVTAVSGSNAAAAGWGGVITRVIGEIGSITVCNQLASGTTAGSADAPSTTAFSVRRLNTVLSNTITGASLSADQVTLPQGIYDFDGSAPCYAANQHKAGLLNVTDGIYYYGTSELVAQAVQVTTRSFFSGRVSVTGTKKFSVVHRIASNTSSDVGGTPANMGVPEIYSLLTFRKVG